MRSLFLILVLSLSACGWHLRGAAQLPPQMAQTRIVSSVQTSELLRQLKRGLSSADVLIVGQEVEDAAVLNVQPSTGRETLSIGPDGRVTEYEIFAKVRFSLTLPTSSFAVPVQEIYLTRDQVFDPLEVLAADKEQILFQKDMERQLAGMILDRISAAYIKYKSSQLN